ncbi:hypothetical protein LTR94_027635, partial [Friedmanniomyces endolithicus]
MSVNNARKITMLICALCAVPVAFAASASNLWVAVGIIGLATAAHQGFSANLYAFPADVFPRSAVGSVVGIGGMLGGIGGMAMAKYAGYVLEQIGTYTPIFIVAASAYLVALLVVHLLSPKRPGGDPPGRFLYLESPMIERRSLLGFSASAWALTGLGRASAQQVLPHRNPTPVQAPEDPAEVVTLWPDGAPGGQEVRVVPIVPERSTDPAFHDRYAQYTTTPVMTVFRPERPNGSALLLVPGGGYRWSVLDKEGNDVARVFAESGTTCFVLRYRLPADGWEAGPDAPLQDAQRALRLIRANADAYGVDPTRIGVLGASAGGHLAGLAS